MSLKEKPTMRYWGLQPDEEVERYKYIVKIFGKGFDGRILDIGCGTGAITKKIKDEMPYAQCIGIDIEEHDNWRHLFTNGLTFRTIDLMELIKEDTKYDVVLMLNSFRNWNSPDREEFVNWLDSHTKYFVTSTNLPYMKSVIGKDIYNVDLELYSIDYPLWKMKKELN